MIISNKGLQIEERSDRIIFDRRGREFVISVNRLDDDVSDIVLRYYSNLKFRKYGRYYIFYSESRQYSRLDIVEMSSIAEKKFLKELGI